MAALRSLRNSSRYSSPFTQASKDNHNANNSNTNVNANTNANANANNNNNVNVTVTSSLEGVNLKADLEAESTPNQASGGDFTVTGNNGNVIVTLNSNSNSNSNTNANANKNGPSLSDPWEEPPVRTPAASFEDTPGLDRQGVLEHMAPLGSLPTSKLLAKLRLAPSRATNNRISSPVPTASYPIPQEDDSVAAPSNGYNSVDTHSPTNLSPRSDSFRPEEMMTTRSGAARGRAGAQDEDYRPPAHSVPATTSSPKSRKLSKSTTPAMATTSSVKSLTTGSASSPPQSIQHVKTEVPWEVMKAHTQLGIEIAENAGEFGTARGLRNFWADGQKDPLVLLALDAVFRKVADRRQNRLLRKYIKAGRAAEAERPTRPHRKSAASPIRPSSQSQLPPANLTYSPDSRSSGPLNSTMPSLAPRLQQPSPPQQEGPHRTIPSRNNSTKSESSTVVVAPAQPVTAGRGLSSFGSGAAVDEEVVRGEGQERLEVPRTRHRRSRSASESSLSSAQSLENPLPDVVHDDAAAEGPKTGAKAGPVTGRRQAPNRQVSVPASSLPSLPPTHRRPVSPDPKPAHAGWRTIGKHQNPRRAGNNKRPAALTPEEEAEFQDRRKRLREETFEYRTNSEVERTEDLRHQFSETVDERTHLDLNRLKSTVLAPTIDPPARPAVVHSLSVYSQANSDNRSSPVDTALSPTIAPSPTLLTFPNLRNGASKKRTRNDMEEEEDAETPTSTGPGDHLMPPTVAQGSSRAGTPRFMGRPSKKARKSARVMVSPQKNKAGGVTAGTARSRGDHPTANGADSNDEDNNEFCSACGGNGQLLCCDGCPNSFHFTCLDPPMDPKQPPEGEWLCAKCRARYHRHEPQARGIFGRLYAHVDDTNPKAFALSSNLRNYFEGVRTGVEGEYEDFVENRQISEPFRTNRMGAPEEPDYKKSRDKDGNLVLCHACGRSTDNGRRELIPCDYCPARFHIDCLDPPLAVPPRRRPGDKPNSTWRCPLHTDVLIQNVYQDRSPEYIATLANGEVLVPRKPKLRRPRNAVPIDVGAERGAKNNGLVDIDLMPEQDDRFQDVDMGGEVYRIPEKGLRLDFIDKVKRSYAEDRVLLEGAKCAKRLRGNLYRPTNQQIQPLDIQLAQTNSLNKTATLNSMYKAQLEANDRAQKALQKRNMREQRAALALKDFAEGVDTSVAVNADEASTASAGTKRTAAEAGLENASGPRKVAKLSMDQLWNGLVGGMPDNVLELFETQEKDALEAAMKMMEERLRELRRVEGKDVVDAGAAITDASANAADRADSQAAAVASDTAPAQDVSVAFTDATATEETQNGGAEGNAETTVDGGGANDTKVASESDAVGTTANALDYTERPTATAGAGTDDLEIIEVD